MHRIREFGNSVGSFSPTRMHGGHLSASLSIVMPVLEGDFRDLRQQPLPGFLKVCARRLEILGRTILMLPWMEAGIKSARPTPLIDVDGHTGALTDRAHTHVTIVDVPGLAVMILVAAADQAGHARCFRPSVERAI
jgi:hypothetical protein